MVASVGVVLAIAIVLALLGVPGPAGAATVERCATLGDRIFGRADVDSFVVAVGAGEPVAIAVDAAPGASAGRARLMVRGPVARKMRARQGMLPLELAPAVVAGGEVTIAVRGAGGQRAFAGDYCVRVTGADAGTLAATADVEVPWVALAADRASVFPPFVRATEGDWSGVIQPLFPLRGARVYGLVVTTRVRDAAGRRLRADAAFAAAAHLKPRGDGPVVRFSDDPDADANPYPDGRLVRSDGTIVVPDRIALRGLDAADPALAAARANLRATADELSQLHGFSTVSPIELTLSAPAVLASVGPESVLLFERTDGRMDLDGLLAAARRHSIRRADVALAISFPTQEIEDGHLAVRARLDALAAAGTFVPTLVDPDPGDDLAIGVFGPGDPEFADFLAATPAVATVVVGLLPSPEFRGADGLFDAARLTGTVPAPPVALDFVLTLPATGTPPYPVVIFQHGFAGSNAQVLSRVSASLAERGLAVIGISAASHGRRGDFLDLLRGTGFRLRDIFRQTNADQMALVRTIVTGIDVDGDGAADLDADRIGYLGISLGGLTGGPFVAVEPRITAAVLNVMSGRTALNGLNATTRPIFTSYFADRVGLAVDSPVFERYLDRQIALGTHAANEADALNFSQRWRRDPFPGSAPRRILMQEGIGDTLVFNVLTEELAMVAGFASNVPHADPAGVSGHWIFAPPGGHGIFDQRADVRSQAATFLASGGTEISAP